MTDDELSLVAYLGECMNRFGKLPVMHPADTGDFVFHIHALQNILMARAAVRAHPTAFRQPSGEKESTQ